MRLESLYFDDIVVIPAGKSVGGGVPWVPLRESSFHAIDGWEIREHSAGIFTVQRDGMSGPVTIGGYGYSYVPSPAPPAIDTRGRRR